MPIDRLKKDTHLVQALCDIGSGLSDWEEEFIEDVAAEVLDEHCELSPKQREKAEEIASKHGV